MATCTRARARRCADMHPRRAAPSATRRGEEQRLGPGRAVVHLSNATTACSAHHSGGYGEHRRREKLQLRCHDARALTSGRAPSVGPRKRWTSEYRVTTPSPTKHRSSSSRMCSRRDAHPTHDTATHQRCYWQRATSQRSIRRRSHDHGHAPCTGVVAAALIAACRRPRSRSLPRGSHTATGHTLGQRARETSAGDGDGDGDGGRYVRPAPGSWNDGGRSAANARRCTQSRSGPQ
jgi:hypothetical protein